VLGASTGASAAASSDPPDVMSHYDTLGVGDDARGVEIREAYRRLARRHHPDRGERDATMAAINEAYRVLGDPGRRAVYDAARRGSAVPMSGAARPASAAMPPRTSAEVRQHPVSLGPARYPWKLVIAMAVVGIAIVLLGVVLFEPREEPPPDNLLEAGSCVVIEDNGDAREVGCNGTGDLVVDQLVPSGAECRTGTSAYRDRQGRGTACVDTTPVTTAPN